MMEGNRSLKTAAVVQATDPGKDMHSGTSKYLHPLLGRNMISYSISKTKQVTGRLPILLLGTESIQIEEDVAGIVQVTTGEDGKVDSSQFWGVKKILSEEIEHLLMLSADRPLVTSASLEKLIQTHQEANSSDQAAFPLTILSTFDHHISGPMQILRDEDGNLVGIEKGEQSPAEFPDSREILTETFCVSTKWLWESLAKIDHSSVTNLQYLIELVQIAISDGLQINTFGLLNQDEALRISSRIDFANAEAILRKRVNHKLMLSGVRLIDPQTTYIEAEVEIGADSVILPNTLLTGVTRIGEYCTIGPNSFIQDSEIGDHCRVNNSVIESATLENHVDIGPFAHLRAGAHLAEGVHMGNFGEVKNSYLGRGTKMGHFSYIGDATIGPNANIGAGVITANYDGQRKHATEIGEGAFIGSDTMLVAPLKIGQNARTGAGSVVTKDVPANSLAVGIPARIIRKKEDDDGP